MIICKSCTNKNCSKKRRAPISWNFSLKIKHSTQHNPPNALLWLSWKHGSHQLMAPSALHKSCPCVLLSGASQRVKSKHLAGPKRSVIVTTVYMSDGIWNMHGNASFKKEAHWLLGFLKDGLIHFQFGTPLTSLIVHAVFLWHETAVIFESSQSWNFPTLMPDEFSCQTLVSFQISSLSSDDNGDRWFPAAFVFQNDFPQLCFTPLCELRIICVWFAMLSAAKHQTNSVLVTWLVLHLVASCVVNLALVQLSMQIKCTTNQKNSACSMQLVVTSYKCGCLSNLDTHWMERFGSWTASQFAKMV